MPHMLVRHSVKDYDTWKRTFDEHADVRKGVGSKGAHIFRSADDANDVVIVFEFEDLDRAREFTNSSQLREIMQQAGVEGPPTFVYMNEADQVPV